jgi:hypothetical protein
VGALIEAGLHEIYLRLPHPGILVSFAASLKNLISPLKSSRSRAMRLCGHLH